MRRRNNPFQKRLTNRRGDQRRVLYAELLEHRELMAADLKIGSIPRGPGELFSDQHETSNGLLGGGGSNGSQPVISLSNTFLLHSRPTATKTIYLDFDGFTARGTPWNATTPIVSPPWDPAGDGAAFSNNELLRIQSVFQRVAADFAPFDVNVTTEDPGEAALVNTGSGDVRWGIRVVFTPDDTPAPGAGGVAFINSFNWGYNQPGATDTPCYVFNTGGADAALAASHEVGHSLGLSHDGTTAQHPSQPSQAYYFGHGTGENSWGPLMGAPYGANVATWDNGVYFGANNNGSNANFGSGPDDLQVITTQNGFGYVPDPEADTRASAQLLSSTVDFQAGISNVSQLGVISKAGDVDVFRFQVGAGTVNLNFDPYITQVWTRTGGSGFSESVEQALFDTTWSRNQSANLDIQATLYDSTGAVIAISEPAGLRASFSNLQLAAGVYYVELDGVGFGAPTVSPPTGYTDYGSIGQYLVTGTLPVALGLIVPSTPVTYVEDSSPVQVTTSATVFDGIPGDYSNSQFSVSIAPAPGASDRLYFEPTLGGLTDTAGVVRAGNQVIAVLSSSSNTQWTWDLTGNTSVQAIENLAQSITFRALGDAPDTSIRSVRFQLTKGSLAGFGDVPINVVPTNDAPSLQNVQLISITEDTLAPASQTVAQLLAGKFSDPDPGSRARGIAVVGNNTPASEGKWQISFGQGNLWQDLPAVSEATRLVLGLNTNLRFTPGADFFGFVTPLLVRAIDDTYTGALSNGNSLIYLPTNLNGPQSPISTVATPVTLEVLPVNDAPRVQVTDLRFSVIQDQALVAQIPVGSVIDIDDTVLEYTARLADGNPLPAWLSLDPVTARFTGTPGPFDVLNLALAVTVKDPAGLKATLPVVIDVININDPPAQLRFVGSDVNENTFGRRIGILSGFDPDNDAIFWNSSDARFTVRDGEVFLNAPLDFENLADRQIQVTFRATDSGSPPLSSSFDVTIKTLDVNEFIPDLESESFVILDGSPAGTLIKTLRATDGDTEQTIRYRLRSGDTSAFTINQQTGELRLLAQANMAAKPQYKVFVEAFDNGLPSFSVTAQIIVGVEPRNFSVPEFAAGQSLQFAENLTTETRVGRIQVSDQDNNPLQFELLSVVGGSSDWVRIDPSNGDVFVTPANRFDFEANQSTSLQVRVTETIAGGNVVTGTVPIQLINVNDRPTGVGGLTIYPRRIGTPVTAGFVVQDQDQSSTGYSIATTDPRFEIRSGRLALKPDQVLTTSQVGQTLSVPIRIVDNSDPTSLADVFANVTVVAANPWQNPVNPLDVNRDGRLSPSDALMVIDRLNAGGSGQRLSNPRAFAELALGDVDTSGDNVLTASDALRVINQLGLQGGAPEGEAAAAKPTENSDAWYMAYSQLEDELITTRRRR